MLWRLRAFPDFCEPHCRAAVGWGTVDRGISSKMLRLPLILLMTCAFALSAHAQRRDSMKNARDDVEAAKKLYDYPQNEAPGVLSAAVELKRPLAPLAQGERDPSSKN